MLYLLQEQWWLASSQLMSDYFSRTFYTQYSDGETAGCSFPINAFPHFPKERIWKASGQRLSSSACLVVWYISTHLRGKQLQMGKLVTRKDLFSRTPTHRFWHELYKSSNNVK